MFLFLFFFVKYFFMTALLQTLVLRVLDKVVLKMFSNFTGNFHVIFVKFQNIYTLNYFERLLFILNIYLA